MSEIPTVLKKLTKKDLPEIEEISKSNPFGSHDLPPEVGLPKLVLEDEPTLGQEFGLDPEERLEPMSLDEPDLPEDFPPGFDEAMQKVDMGEDPFHVPSEGFPFNQPKQKDTNEDETMRQFRGAEEAGTQNNAAIEELSEQRRVNESLRKQIEKLAQEQGGKIPDGYWNLQLRTEVAEEKAKSLEIALHKARETPKQVEVPQTMPEPRQGQKKLPGNACILFPCMKTTNPLLASILFSIGKDYGDQVTLIPRMGDSMIYHSRNVLADTMLKDYPNMEWVMWIDDDMIPPIGRPKFIRDHTGIDEEEYPDRFFNIHFLERLMSHKKTLVGGTYFGRRKIAPAMFKEGIDNAAAYQAAKEGRDEIRQTEWVATGLMLVHRSVFEAIRKKFPDLAPTDKRTYWDYFRPDDAGGEDVMFCHRAKTAGHQPWVDTGLHALHYGGCCYGRHNTDNPNVGKGSSTNWWA